MRRETSSTISRSIRFPNVTGFNPRYQDRYSAVSELTPNSPSSTTPDTTHAAKIQNWECLYLS